MNTQNHKTNTLLQDVIQLIFSTCPVNAARHNFSIISFENILTPVSLIFFDQHLHTFQISKMHASCLANIILLNYSALKNCERNVLHDILQSRVAAHRTGQNGGTTKFYVLLTLHLDILCNENQPDAPFILNLFSQSPLHVSAMFIAHHQEVFTVYVQQLVHIIRLS
jgi:hypothetical protein